MTHELSKVEKNDKELFNPSIARSSKSVIFQENFILKTLNEKV